MSAINSIREWLKAIGLKQKIWVTMAVVSIGAVLIVIGLTYFLYERFYVDNQKDTLLLQGNNLKDVYMEDGEGGTFQERLRWMNENMEAEIIFTQNPMELSGALPYEEPLQESLITFEERQKLLDGETVTMVRQHPLFEQDILAVAIPLLEGDALSGAVFLYMPLDDVYAPFHSISLILIGAILILLSLLVWAGRKIAAQLVQPLENMRMISEEMAGGDFTKRMEVVSSDEVGALAHSFNRLSQSLEEVENNRREFLQNVSHELRTPLSYMRGYTEAIIEGVMGKEEEKKYIRITHQETIRLSRLVHDLLDLAQLEGESYPMQLDILPFSQLVLEVVEKFRLPLQQKGMDCKVELDEELIIKGDADRLEQVLSNLLDNAIRYSQEGDGVTINVRQEEDRALLEIHDTGAGIPEKDLAKIMDRFYRVHKSRSRKEGGSGLGLAIVKQIIVKHEADINIQSKENEWTKITLSFPLLDLEDE
ncbi:sensor histidine kinase [Bacillus sp. SB49]|uniref:sensor histidine kinase n=1 Tax=Bacillus sp. SB49 TaxID=1071080 RepID=UPI0003FC4647|nr:HAMP domain-containing sensor histidine kinase [Bacillus sp. SB49]